MVNVGENQKLGENQNLEKNQNPVENQHIEADTLLMERTMRSGQKVRFDGNVVIMGDVNPGAEIVATGNVVVLGTLRGLIHAGAAGNIDATIMALGFMPTQLRIASHITRSPDGMMQEDNFDPEIAFLDDGQVVIEKYVVSK